MRGIDYRSADTSMTLVVAKSFENHREAIQGFNRVGRFGDSCCRVKFNEVQLVDKKLEMLYNASLMKFITEMQKKPLTLKPISVKVAKTEKSKKTSLPKSTTTYVSKILGQRRTQLLMGQS